jgi:hypothetical protein
MSVQSVEKKRLAQMMQMRMISSDEQREKVVKQWLRVLEVRRIMEFAGVVVKNKRMLQKMF